MFKQFSKFSVIFFISILLVFKLYAEDEPTDDIGESYLGEEFVTYAGKLPEVNQAPLGVIDSQSGLVHYSHTTGQVMVKYHAYDFVGVNGHKTPFYFLYTSRRDQEAHLGGEWSHNFDLRLEILEDEIILKTAQRHDRFSYDSRRKIYKSVGELTAIIMPNEAETEYTLRDPFGNESIFEKNSDASGRLKKIVDPFGNTMCFNYIEEEGFQLSTIYDSLNRPASFTYNTQNNVEKIFYLNQCFPIGYKEVDGKYFVSTLSTPPVLEDDEYVEDGKIFRNGKTHKFIYDYRGHEREELRGLLTGIIAPKQVKEGSDKRQYSFAYDDVLESDSYLWHLGSNHSDGTSYVLKYRRARNKNPDTEDQYNEVAYMLELLEPLEKLTAYYRAYCTAQGFVRETQEMNTDNKSKIIEGYKYNKDYNVIVHNHTMKNGVTYSTYDEDSINPLSHDNLILKKVYSDSRGSGDQRVLVQKYSYEPIFNHLLTVVDPRAFDSNGEPNGMENECTTWLFRAYMENLELTKREMASKLGLTRQEIEELFAERNLVSQGDLNGDGEFQLTHRLIKMQGPNVHMDEIVSELGIFEDLTQTFEHVYRYNSFGQMTYSKDPEGNVTEMSYFPANDPDGDGKNLLKGNDPNTGGYLKTIIADTTSSPERNSGTNPKPVNARTDYGYLGEGGERGYVTTVTDRRGVRAFFRYNAINQVIEAIRSHSFDQSRLDEHLFDEFPKGYRKQYAYDANNNVIQVNIQKDETGEFIKKTYDYDIQNKMKQMIEDKGGLNIITKFGYNDRQHNSGRTDAYGTLVERTTTTESTSRGLIMRQTWAKGVEDQEVTFTYQYGRDNRLVATIDGGGDCTRYALDGFGRPIQVTDPMGNYVKFNYNQISQITRARYYNRDGKRLAKIHYHYDAQGRLFRTDTELLGDGDLKEGEGLFDGEDNNLSTLTVYDQAGRVYAYADDERDVTKMSYDGLSRVIKREDPLGNTVESVYDNSGNSLSSIRTDVSELIEEPEVFVSGSRYDSLNRLTRVIEPNGQETKLGYDARNNIILTVDALGNETEIDYDNLDRSIQTRRYLSTDGKNASRFNFDKNQSGDGMITTEEFYDELHRRIAQRDDNGNTTSYGHHLAFNYVTLITYADGTQTEMKYNSDGEMVREKDGNGSVAVKRYDDNSRLIHVTIEPSDVASTTIEQSFVYDGLNRMIESRDGNEENQVITHNSYDSLSRLLTMSQEIWVNLEKEFEYSVSYGYTGNDNTSLVYPNGNVITYEIDPRSRISKIHNGDGSEIAGFYYVGSRKLKCEYGNGVVNSMLSPDNQTIGYSYDTNGRRLIEDHRSPDGDLIAGFKNIYNENNQRIEEVRLHFNRGDIYVPDSEDRMRAFHQNAEWDGQKLNTVPGNESIFELDGVNNFRSYVKRGEDQNPIVDDKGRVNEYSQFGGNNLFYDENGNLKIKETSEGEKRYVYDANNRLVRFREFGLRRAAYMYDTQGRRVMKIVYDDEGNESQKTYFCYSGFHVIEERTVEKPFKK